MEVYTNAIYILKSKYVSNLRLTVKKHYVKRKEHYKRANWKLECKNKRLINLVRDYEILN